MDIIYKYIEPDEFDRVLTRIRASIGIKPKVEYVGISVLRTYTPRPLRQYNVDSLAYGLRFRVKHVIRPKGPLKYVLGRERGLDVRGFVRFRVNGRVISEGLHPWGYNLRYEVPLVDDVLILFFHTTIEGTYDLLLIPRQVDGPTWDMDSIICIPLSEKLPPALKGLCIEGVKPEDIVIDVVVYSWSVYPAKRKLRLTEILAVRTHDFSTSRSSV